METVLRCDRILDPIRTVAVSAITTMPLVVAVGCYNTACFHNVHIGTFDEESNSVYGFSFWHPHLYKLMLHPTQPHSMFASSDSDILRFWRTGNSSPTLFSTYQPGAHITSFDWNQIDTSLVSVSAIDGRLRVWDFNTQRHVEDLVAHHQPVNEVAWQPGNNRSSIASASSDGSIRLFDLRVNSRPCSAYPVSDASPLVRLTWNREDPNYIATSARGSDRVVVLDIRTGSRPVLDGRRHRAPVSALAWHNGSLYSGDLKGKGVVWGLASGPVCDFSVQSMFTQLQSSRVSADEWCITAAFANKLKVHTNRTKQGAPNHLMMHPIHMPNNGGSI